MYAPCKMLIDAASKQARQGESQRSRLLLNRIVQCGNKDCQFQAECRNYTCLLEEANEAA